MQKFCYKCGALEEEKGPLIEGLCRDCFLEEKPLIKVPEELEMKVCDRCGAYFFENAWHDIEENPTAEYVEAAKELVNSEAEVLSLGPAGPRYVNFEDSDEIDISYSADYSAPDTINLGLEVRGKFFDSQEEPLLDNAEVVVKLVEETCEVCGRMLSGYYEALLQVRSEGDIPEKKLSNVFQALREEALKVQNRSRDQFVSKVKKKHGGIDFYTSSAKLARRLARFLKKEYGAEMSESAELVGQTSDGQEKYRVTVVARLPF